MKSLFGKHSLNHCKPLWL